MDRYELSLTAGEWFYLVATDTGGTDNFEPFIELYRPDGTRVATAGGFSSDLADIYTTAPVTGTYSLLVHDYNLNWTGNYSVTLTKPLGP